MTGQPLALLILGVLVAAGTVIALTRPGRTAVAGGALRRCPVCGAAGFQRRDNRITWVSAGCAFTQRGRADVAAWTWQRHPKRGVA